MAQRQNIKPKVRQNPQQNKSAEEVNTDNGGTIDLEKESLNPVDIIATKDVSTESGRKDFIAAAEKITHMSDEDLSTLSFTSLDDHRSEFKQHLEDAESSSDKALREAAKEMMDKLEERANPVNFIERAASLMNWLDSTREDASLAAEAFVAARSDKGKVLHVIEHGLKEHKRGALKKLEKLAEDVRSDSINLTKEEYSHFKKIVGEEFSRSNFGRSATGSVRSIVNQGANKEHIERLLKVADALEGIKVDGKKVDIKDDFIQLGLKNAEQKTLENLVAKGTSIESVSISSALLLRSKSQRMPLGIGSKSQEHAKKLLETLSSKSGGIKPLGAEKLADSDAEKMKHLIKKGIRNYHDPKDPEAKLSKALLSSISNSSGISGTELTMLERDDEFRKELIKIATDSSRLGMAKRSLLKLDKNNRLRKLFVNDEKVLSGVALARQLSHIKPRTATEADVDKMQKAVRTTQRLAGTTAVADVNAHALKWKAAVAAHQPQNNQGKAASDTKKNTRYTSDDRTAPNEDAAAQGRRVERETSRTKELHNAKDAAATRFDKFRIEKVEYIQKEFPGEANEGKRIDLVHQLKKSTDQYTQSITALNEKADEDGVKADTYKKYADKCFETFKKSLPTELQHTKSQQEVIKTNTLLSEQMERLTNATKELQSNLQGEVEGLKLNGKSISNNVDDLGNHVMDVIKTATKKYVDNEIDNNELNSTIEKVCDSYVREISKIEDTKGRKQELLDNFDATFEHQVTAPLHRIFHQEASQPDGPVQSFAPIAERLDRVFTIQRELRDELKESLNNDDQITSIPQEIQEQVKELAESNQNFISKLRAQPTEQITRLQTHTKQQGDELQQENEKESRNKNVQKSSALDEGNDKAKGPSKENQNVTSEPSSEHSEQKTHVQRHTQQQGDKRQEENEKESRNKNVQKSSALDEGNDKVDGRSEKNQNVTSEPSLEHSQQKTQVQPEKLKKESTPRASGSKKIQFGIANTPTSEKQTSPTNDNSTENVSIEQGEKENKKQYKQEVNQATGKITIRDTNRVAPKPPTPKSTYDEDTADIEKEVPRPVRRDGTLNAKDQQENTIKSKHETDEIKELALESTTYKENNSEQVQGPEKVMDLAGEKMDENIQDSTNITFASKAGLETREENEAEQIHSTDRAEAFHFESDRDLQKTNGENLIDNSDEAQKVDTSELERFLNSDEIEISLVEDSDELDNSLENFDELDKFLDSDEIDTSLEQDTDLRSNDEKK